MNFHSDEWIMNKMQEHYEDAKSVINDNRIIALCLQGSQNYGLDVENSDVDTKLFLTPTFNDLVFNKKPISTTWIRDNDEHIDLKDFRLGFQIFRKQNVNFIEVLFSDYTIVNPIYKPYWDELVKCREGIARYNRAQAVKTMKGLALEKYHALKRESPSKAEIIKEFGYDAKQLHHLVRIEDFILNYTKGKFYDECLRPAEDTAEFLKEIKQQGRYSLAEAEHMADITLESLNKAADSYIQENKDEPPLKWVDECLDRMQYAIMREAMKTEF